MRINGVLETVFGTAKPQTKQPMSSLGAPVSVVYNNGVALAPAAPPVVANLAAGRYSLTYALTPANGHAPNDFVTITEGVTLDGAAITRPAWEGNLVQDGVDITPLYGQTLYPMFTTRRPSTGANRDPDQGAPPAVIIYRNMVATALVPALLHPAVGVWIVTLPLTFAQGWTVGDQVGVLAMTVMDGIAAEGWVFCGGPIVSSVGGGVPHHEIIGHELRYQ